jgi:hypothetical protein
MVEDSIEVVRGDLRAQLRVAGPRHLKHRFLLLIDKPVIVGLTSFEKGGRRE